MVSRVAVACAISVTAAASPAVAQATAPETRTIIGEEYTPTIWVDPDGCEHWVFDDGFEGFMSPHRNRDGSPVCRRQEICGIIPTDTLFATNRASITNHQRTQLAEFFAGIDAFGVLIYGHTDARASDEYNMRLSQRRADTVTSVALDAGVRVVESRGFGERRPAQAGSSAAAYKANRRVEVICLR
ncbi:MAG: OmpA family protein [Pseudomonadota bacterium]